MQLLLFCGVQASGKSSYYKAHFADTHIRLNLDMLRTRYREALLFHACLQAKQPCVIDNTNPTAAARAKYLTPARAAHFQSIAYYFETPLADALAKYPAVFNDVYVNMVRAGEAGGILDDILKRLALQQEKNASMRKKIKSAMTYPIVLLVIAITAFLGMMIFVIPQIGKMMQDLGGPDQQLPAITQVMLAISDVMVKYGLFILPVVIAGVVFLLRWLKTPKGRHIFHRVVLKIPAVGGIVKKVAVARFARTFSALMGSGAAVLEALEVTARAVGNVVYEDMLRDAAKQVENGKQLSTVIEKSDLFPPIVAQMLSVGEETGQTDVVLVKVADFYEEEVDVAIDGISSIIEPVMIVIMGGVIGLVAVSVMAPIAGLASSVKS